MKPTYWSEEDVMTFGVMTKTLVYNNAMHQQPNYKLWQWCTTP